MTDTAALAYAWSAGVLAALNPCGSALLLAYLARRLEVAGAGGAAGQSRPAPASSPAGAVWAALRAAAGTGAGFVLAFGGMAALLATTGRAVLVAAPWLQAVLALALVAAGVHGLRGKGWYLSAPAGWSAALAGRGNVLFGVAYGLASVSCTLPVFLVVLGAALAARAGALPLVLLAYAAGVMVPLMALALLAALAGEAARRHLGAVLAVRRYAGPALLLAAGAWLLWRAWPALLLAAGR